MSKEDSIELVHGSTDWETAPLEVLERQLTSWAATIAAAEAMWLQWLGAYTRREGFLEWGCRSAAHWLSWKCGMSLVTAREKVRVALALEQLPLVTAAFSEGRLSYSKVRALSRVANEFNEADLVAMALTASGAQLDAICSGYLRSRPGADEAVEALAKRSFTVRDNNDGTSTIAWTVPTDAAHAIQSQVAAEVQDEIEQSVAMPDTSDGPKYSRKQLIADRGGMAAMRSDAAAVLLTRSNSGAVSSNDARSCAVAAAEVTLVVGASAEAPIVGEVAGTSVADVVAERLSCDSRITTLIENTNGEPLAVGRATRLINRRLRLALERRDQHMCRFAGCGTRRHLHAHHIIHWSRGGPTDLENLMLLCHFHHHLVHDGGWTITPDGRFVRPDGAPVDTKPDTMTANDMTAAVGDALTVMRDHVGATEPHRLEPESFGPFDLPWTTTILHHSEQLARQQHTFG